MSFFFNGTFCTPPPFLNGTAIIYFYGFPYSSRLLFYSSSTVTLLQGSAFILSAPEKFIELALWSVKQISFRVAKVHKYTELCNHNLIFFQKMSSWTALAMRIGIKTTFQTKYLYMYSKYIQIFVMMISNFHYIIRKYILTLELSSTKSQFYEFLVVECCVF